MKTVLILSFTILLIIMISFSEKSYAQKSPEELAKELSNPVANLISVPIQSNWDVGIGNWNGSRMVLNIQPVIPFSLSKKLNLITRWILPVISQIDITSDIPSQAGLSDALISTFFSPSQSSITWGVGPAFLLPTATDDYLGTKKWGIGPSLVVLKQVNGWTYGGLINNVWSFAGDDERGDVNALFFNPFVGYNWKSGAGITCTAEYTEDWINDKSTVVTQAMFSGVTKFGEQTVALAVGPRIHFAPDNHADYGVRAVVTLVFPKGK